MGRGCIALLLFPALVGAMENTSPPERLAEGRKRFELHCSACHSLALPRSQHLDRKTWKWVIDDMVAEFGATLLRQEDQKLILDYLVHEHGPEK